MSRPRPYEPVLSGVATTDESGRPVQHILLGEFHLSYWPDHAARELRIVEIDEV
jgi:hypothetical protein